MSRPAAFFLMTLLLASSALAQNSNTVLLDGAWLYRPEARTTLKADGSIVDDTHNLPPGGQMPVPSNWHLHGLANFNGRVRFERNFNFPARLQPQDRVFVVFHGVDYFTTTEINGTAVGKHEGYFQEFEFDVTQQVKFGRNHIAVIVDAPREEPGTVWPDHKRLIKGVFSHWDCKPGGTDPATGQDGTSAGIWNHVELQVRHTAWLGTVKIQPYLFERKLIPEHEKEAGTDALLFITAEVYATRPGSYSVTAEITGNKISVPVQVSGPHATALLTVPMQNPKLWWTWDLGDPYLYTAKVSVQSGEQTLYQRPINFGVRTITLDEKTGDWRLNGVRFFIRGTSITPDMWLAHYTPHKIQQDIQLLRKAYINGVRVCVHVNREELYDALDRAGIVAWQDFPLQWDYTQSNDFLEEASHQLRDMIRQFYNHPSIITWVCQNESSAYNVNVLDPFLARVGAQEDSSRPVRPVSHYKEHFYAGWYEGDYHNYSNPPGGPIISELGAQALPSKDEVREMAGDAWPPDWKKLAYHNFQYNETFNVAKLPMPQNWSDFITNSQRYQAELLQYAIEHYRRVKYKQIGSFFQFQFVDCWPAVTWSVVSYGRQPKPGFAAMQRAYQPVLITGDLD
jgi:beta-mannosidase